MENSSTMTSEHEMYKKEPPAKQENTISTISLDPPSKIPNVTPIGVNTPNKQIMVVTNLFSSGKVFAILIPRDIPAAPLCITMASAKISTFFISLFSPRASPSKMACVPRPTSKTKGVKLLRQLGFFIG